MDDLTIPDTGDDRTLAAYWRAKYDALRAETTQITIRSLRSQLLTCKRIATDRSEEPRDALRRIAVHAQIGLDANE